MNELQACKLKLEASGSSFHRAIKLLPKKFEDPVVILYAICRELDDIADSAISPEIKNIKLQWWRQDLNKAFTGKPEHPFNIALRSIVSDYSLTPALFQQLVIGMFNDLSFKTPETIADLKLYCHRVAGIVGIIITKICNKHLNELHYQACENFGFAVQLTNIIRDLKEDLEQGRNYIPKNITHKYNINQISSSNYLGFIDELIQLSEQHYKRGFLQIKQHNIYFPQKIIINIYYRLFKKIRANKKRLFQKKIKLNKFEIFYEIAIWKIKQLFSRS